MIACLRLPGMPAGGPLPDLLEALAQLTPFVEAEGGLELRADARPRHARYVLPRTQMDDPPAAACYLDLGVLDDEHGPDAAQQIHQIATQGGHPAAIGLAGGKFPARAAALLSLPGHVALVPKGREAAFLAPLPAALLPVDDETLRQFDLLGLRALGQIAALPPAALADRFGGQGRILHRLASGRDTSPVRRYEPPLDEHLSRDLDPPLADRPLLARILGMLVEELAARLGAGARAAREVTLALQLADGRSLARGVTLRQPSGNTRHLARTAHELLASLSVPGPVSGIAVRLGGVAPVEARQMSLFDREPVRHEQLQALLKTLIPRYGDCFFRAALTYPDADRPEQRFTLTPAGEP